MCHTSCCGRYFKCQHLSRPFQGRPVEGHSTHNAVGREGPSSCSAITMDPTLVFLSTPCGRRFNLRFYKVRTTGAWRDHLPFSGTPVTGSTENRRQRRPSVCKASASPPGCLLKCFTLFTPAAKHSSKKPVHPPNFTPANQTYTTQAPERPLNCRLFTTVIADVSILFFTGFVSPRLTRSQQEPQSRQETVLIVAGQTTDTPVTQTRFSKQIPFVLVIYPPG